MKKTQPHPRAFTNSNNERRYAFALPGEHGEWLTCGTGVAVLKAAGVSLNACYNSNHSSPPQSYVRVMHDGIKLMLARILACALLAEKVGYLDGNPKNLAISNLVVYRSAVYKDGRFIPGDVVPSAEIATRQMALLRAHDEAHRVSLISGHGEPPQRNRDYLAEYAQ